MSEPKTINKLEELASFYLIFTFILLWWFLTEWSSFCNKVGIKVILLMNCISSPFSQTFKKWWISYRIFFLFALLPSIDMKGSTAKFYILFTYRHRREFKNQPNILISQKKKRKLRLDRKPMPNPEFEPRFFESQSISCFTLQFLIGRKEILFYLTNV